MTYLPSSDTAATGRYQVLLYDNNFGATERYPKFDWGQLGAAVATDYSKGTHSFGRIFTVDETVRTYELVDQIAVPFSGYASSAQRVGDSNSMLVASGKAKTFAEYDRYGLPIATYEMESREVHLPRVQVRAVALRLAASVPRGCARSRRARLASRITSHRTQRDRARAH